MKKLIILISLLTFFLVSNAQEEWTIIHPYPTASNYKDAHFISDKTGWVVGSNELIMYTNDSCKTWEIQHTDPLGQLESIYFTSDNEGWAVGWNKIFHTTNAGNDWELQNCPSIQGDLMDVYFLNQDTGWIVGTYQIVLKTTNGGQHWEKIMNLVPGNKNFYSLAFTDGLHGCAVGGIVPGAPAGVIMVTDDGGLTWVETTPIENDIYKKVFFKNTIEGWVCGNSGALMKTMDGGYAWEDKSFFGYDFRDIHFFDDNNGILFRSNCVHLTFDGGESWDSNTFIGTTSVSSSSSWDYNKIIAVGSSNDIYRSINGGSSWENLNKNMGSIIQQIGFFNPLEGFAIVGINWSKQLIRSYDGGHTWQLDTLVPSGPFSFYRMWLSGPSCYLINFGQQIMKTNDGGENWKLVEAPGGLMEYFGLQFTNENTGYLCSLGGRFVKTIDGGETWTDKSLADVRYFRYMFFLNENKGWLSDTQGQQIFRTGDGGDSWYITSLIDDIICTPMNIFFINENIGYATTFQGKLFKTSNGGDSWERIQEFASGNQSLVHFISENEGWVTSAGLVYHTYDGGLSWDDGQHLGTTMFDIFFLNDNQGWLSGDGGRVASYDLTVGISKITPGADVVSIFPNPARDEVTMKLMDNNDKVLYIKVFDMQGRQVMHFSAMDKSSTMTISTSALTSGVYVIHITSINGKNLIKFIKD